MAMGWSWTWTWKYMYNKQGIAKTCFFVIQIKVFCGKSTKLNKNRIKLIETTLEKQRNPESNLGNTAEFREIS
jgi:hypothetical protein